VARVLSLLLLCLRAASVALFFNKAVCVLSCLVLTPGGYNLDTTLDTYLSIDSQLHPSSARFRGVLV
jgi:hypothetical protein